MLTLAAAAGIVVGTLVSEDLTAIAVGLAVRDGSLPAVGGVFMVALGIFAGDAALWAAGRFASGWAPISRLFRRAPGGHLAAIGDLIEHRTGALILGSRLVPGTRLAVYVAAGASRRASPSTVLAWMAAAVLIWSPAIVLGAAVLGGPVMAAREGTLGWATRLGVALALLAGLRLVRLVATPAGRESIRNRYGRLRHWEFWPSWLLNLPVGLWVAALALRHRSLMVVTAANPGLPDGGVVGESKSAILAVLPAPWVLPWTVVNAGTVEERFDQACRIIRARDWEFPIVGKPDVGQRGVGVRWLRNEADLGRYLEAEAGAVILQVAHEGPFEAGVFYVRRPGEATGRIWSLTDKRFPEVVGDGRSTLAQLIAVHPRHRLQGDIFRARLADVLDRVPATGERVPLGRTGNHCQGTQFLDGAGLVTPALEARIDAIARAVPGFHFGRFDVRYRDRAAFMAGTDLAIVELNGVTSEATHIYDPANSIWNAWVTLARQWSVAFAIGAANRRRGIRPAPGRRIAAAAWQFLRAPIPQPVAD